jgi:hypothetical protein
MKRYLAVKFYGHYVNAYIVEAENEKLAYKNAIYGKPILAEVFNNFYGEGGFVKSIGVNATIESQFEWLIEAIELGLPATKEQHEVVFGLPFVIPGVKYMASY